MNSLEAKLDLAVESYKAKSKVCSPKLTEEQIRELWKLWSTKSSQKELLKKKARYSLY